MLPNHVSRTCSRYFCPCLPPARWCREQPPCRHGLDAIARDYVLLSLTIGEKEEGYIDAYYGPPELQARAKAEAAGQSLDALAKRTAALPAVARRRRRAASRADQRRARFLAAQLTAAATRLRMLQGEKLSFDDEAKGCSAFGRS